MGLSRSNAFLNCPFAQCLRNFYPVIINHSKHWDGWKALPSFVKWEKGNHDRGDWKDEVADYRPPQ